MAKRQKPTGMIVPQTGGYPELVAGISELLERARRMAARTVNSILTATYWEIGRRIVEYEQGGGARAEYGEVLIKRMARDLQARHGRGFSHQGLYKMRAFYLGWADCPDSVGKIRSQGNIPDTVGNISAGCGIPVRPQCAGRADLPDTVGRIRNCADTVCAIQYTLDDCLSALLVPLRPPDVG